MKNTNIQKYKKLFESISGSYKEPNLKNINSHELRKLIALNHSFADANK
ncbi:MULTISPECIES: hypothetical protein [Cysteiniphilum]|uniref:Uncharacterized protein n=1 Tax=Cysteiniphilum litorale TaxID=2056700 RepID=A0A8J2Z4T5_9GAMM|nr:MULTISPECIES: hypothetical protein [Cysteiniphilum]GGF99067.1 hypothetical protein GCM10010995_15430 [Cysteiniphilum litorale]